MNNHDFCYEIKRIGRWCTDRLDEKGMEIIYERFHLTFDDYCLIIRHSMKKPGVHCDVFPYLENEKWFDHSVNILTIAKREDLAKTLKNKFIELEISRNINKVYDLKQEKIEEKPIKKRVDFGF